MQTVTRRDFLEAPGSIGSETKSIALGAVDPALEGSFTVEGIAVQPAFVHLRAEAMKFPPEATQEVTGVHPDMVRTEAFLYGVCGRGARRQRGGRSVGHRGALRRPALVPSHHRHQRGSARSGAARRRATDRGVGTRGTALVWDNGAWIKEDTGTDASLRAVWVSGDGTAWAVGDGGTVRRRSP